MTPRPILVRAASTAVIAAIPDHVRANLLSDNSSARLAAENCIVDRIMWCWVLETCEHDQPGLAGHRQDYAGEPTPSGGAPSLPKQRTENRDTDVVLNNVQIKL
tara:strand:- start:412 stop:723 length:312 start_codon:yes stop_codon:yes gene_type:complete